MSVYAVAEGIGLMSDANTDCVETTGVSVLFLVSIYLPLQQAWSKILTEDAENVYIANLKVPGNPAGTVIVAQLTEERNIDSTNADKSTGFLDTIIQGDKGQSQLLGNAVSDVFNVETPINELLKAESDGIQSML